jgi:tetratricopeptide (TPR) repeat protein
MHRRIVVALGIATLAILPTPPVAAQDLGAALRALDYGQDDAARSALRAQAAEASFWLAVTQRGAERKASAERAASLATDDQAWIRSAATGLAAQADGKLADAVADVREAASRSPRDARLWKVLGDLQLEQGDGAGAKSSYEQAVALQPAYPTANEALGDLARRAGDFGPAFNAYNHALDADNQPTSALVGRATARLYMGDGQGALADLQLAATEAPPGADRSRALMGIVLAQTYLGRLPQGLERAEQAMRMWQELGRADMQAATANATGRLLLETGDPTTGASWYERGWQAIEGSDLPADQRIIWHVRELHGLARAAAQGKDLAKARQYAQQATDLMASDPANAEHYAWIGPYLEGYLLLAERRYDEAVTELHKSDLDRPFIRYLLGEAYFRARDRTSAHEWYQKALDASTGLDTESVLVRPLATAWLTKYR